MSNRSATRFVTFVAIVCAAVFATRCGSNTSPSSTTGGPAVSSVALNATSIAVGSNGQGTVSLTGTATTAVSVSVTSSNPAVAAVQSPVTIVAGASSAAITVTGMSAGTATITAALNGSTKQSPTLTVTTPAPALAAISLSSSSVVGGNPVTGTATLTAAAPTGGAVVTLTGGDPVTVPANVTVSAGSTTATFSVTTRAVGGDTSATIGGSYGGVTKSAVLAVTRPTVATAKFGVTGPSETETCELSSNGTILNCTFDASTSSAPGNITEYDWTYSVTGSTSQTTQTSTGPKLVLPPFSCSMMPAPPLPAGNQWFTFTVTLKIHDDQGNISPVTIDNGARLLPQGSCGF